MRHPDSEHRSTDSAVAHKVSVDFFVVPTVFFRAERVIGTLSVPLRSEWGLWDGQGATSTTVCLCGAGWKDDGLWITWAPARATTSDDDAKRAVREPRSAGHLLEIARADHDLVSCSCSLLRHLAG